MEKDTNSVLSELSNYFADKDPIDIKIELFRERYEK